MSEMLPTITKARNIYKVYMSFPGARKKHTFLVPQEVISRRMYRIVVLSELCNSASKPNHHSDISVFNRSDIKTTLEMWENAFRLGNFVIY